MKSATTNKWFKYWLLKRYKRLARYLPETRIMTHYAFRRLLSKYKHIILKPVRGSRGRGIFQVSSLGNHMYAVHYENLRFTIRGKTNTYSYLKRRIGSTPYMVQRRIARPTVGGRPFDMRVIVQRRRNSNVWKVTGKVAKVAGKGYIVSNNTRSRGALLLFKTAIRQSSIQHLSRRRLQSKMERIAIRSAKRLAGYFKGHRMYGLDMGPDQNGHMWIIEANLFPARSHFLKLKDQRMYRRISSYKRG
jgi:glutathione synthase/RimK-type ligase-like ATP-grasp enzyme